MPFLSLKFSKTSGFLVLFLGQFVLEGRHINNVSQYKTVNKYVEVIRLLTFCFGGGETKISKFPRGFFT